MSTVCPSVSHFGTLFGSSIHACVTVAGFLHVDLCVFHQKFEISSIPSIDQLFLFIIVFPNSCSMVYNFCTCLILSFILSLIFSIRFLLGVSLSPAYMSAQIFTNLSIVSTFPLHVDLSFVFLRKFPSSFWKMLLFFISLSLFEFFHFHNLSP